MEKTLVTILVILALAIGIVGGAVFAPSDTVTKEVEKIVYQNVSVDKIVEIPAEDTLSLAIDAFLQAVEDEEDESGNDFNVSGNYNFDEVEVSKVYDSYTITYDNYKTTVDFSIRLKFDDGEARIKETYNVIVIFEEDEDTEVTIA